MNALQVLDPSRDVSDTTYRDRAVDDLVPLSWTHRATWRFRESVEPIRSFDASAVIASSLIVESCRTICMSDKILAEYYTSIETGRDMPITAGDYTLIEPGHDTPITARHDSFGAYTYLDSSWSYTNALETPWFLEDGMDGMYGVVEQLKRWAREYEPRAEFSSPYVSGFEDETVELRYVVFDVFIPQDTEYDMFYDNLFGRVADRLAPEDLGRLAVGVMFS